MYLLLSYRILARLRRRRPAAASSTMRHVLEETEKLLKVLKGVQHGPPRLSPSPLPQPATDIAPPPDRRAFASTAATAARPRRSAPPLRLPTAVSVCDLEAVTAHSAPQKKSSSR